MTATFGVLQNYRRLLVLAAVALAAAVVMTLIVFTREAYANGAVHGGYSASTSGCANCHRTHQAKSSSKLLSQPSAFLLCLSCHNGSGASNDVVDGVKIDAVPGALPNNGYSTGLNARYNGTNFQAWVNPVAQPIDTTQTTQKSMYTVYVKAATSGVSVATSLGTPYARNASDVIYGSNPFGTPTVSTPTTLAPSTASPDAASIVSTIVTIPKGTAAAGDVDVVPLTLTDTSGESYTLTFETWVDNNYNTAGPGGAFNATLLGGGFEYVYGKRVTSRHPADPALQMNEPWGDAGSGVLTAALASYANGTISPSAVGQTGQQGANTLTSALECVTCHDPHGNTNYRMLKTLVNGTPVMVKAFTNSAITGKIESSTVDGTIGFAIAGTETVAFTEGGTPHTTAALAAATANTTTLATVAADLQAKMQAAAGDSAITVEVIDDPFHGEPDGKLLISAWPLSSNFATGATPVTGNATLNTALKNLATPSNPTAINDPTVAGANFVADEPGKDYINQHWGSMFAGRASSEGGANASGGLSNFCAACHTAYISDGASIGLTGGSPSETHYRHRTETSWISWIDPRNGNADNAVVDSSGTHNFQRSNPDTIGYINVGNSSPSAISYLPLANAPYSMGTATSNILTTLGASPANTTYGNANAGTSFNVSAYVLNCETCHRPHGTEASVSATGAAGSYASRGAPSPAQGGDDAGVITSGVVESNTAASRIAFGINGTTDTITFQYGGTAALTVTPAAATQDVTTLSAVASDLQSKMRTAAADVNITVTAASSSVNPGNAVLLVNGPKLLTITASTNTGFQTAFNTAGGGMSNDSSPVAAAQSGVVESGTTEGTIGFAIAGETVTFTDNGVTHTTAALTAATANTATLATVAADLQAKMRAAASDASITVAVVNTVGTEPDGYFSINSKNVIVMTSSTNASLNTALAGITNTNSMGPSSFRNAGITHQSTLLRLPERGVCEVCHQWSGKGNGTATP